MAPIGGIDVHENKTGARSGEHGQQPLEAVRGPDPQALARREPAGREPTRHALDGCVELAKGVADRLLGYDHCTPVCAARHRAFEHSVDSLKE
jgi:hypothetical protein